jgi:hypothetical protein
MKLLTKCLLFSIFLLLPILSGAQVSVTATAGTVTGSYTTLKVAFDAINFGIHQGQIDIAITGSIIEPVSAVLNTSGGQANYSKVRITPTSTCTISGNINGPIMFLNGADSVTIDGRIGGIGNTRSLTIQNSYASGTGTAVCALQVDNLATCDTFRYVNLQSASQSLLVGYWTTYSFIYNNEARGIGTGLQSSGIVCAGSNNIITNNLVHDFSAFGITLPLTMFYSPVNNIVKDNSLYKTVATAASGTFINVTGGGHTITRNFIGGSAPLTGGSMGVYGSVTGINCTGSAAIDSNIITNIQAVGFTGITATGGSIGLNQGNIIGSATDTGKVRSGSAKGINIGVGGIVRCKNNIIGGITTFGALVGLSGSPYFSTTDTSIVSDNTIGGSLANSLKNYGPNGYVTGMELTAVACFIKQNTISHLYNYATTFASNLATLGISCSTQKFLYIQDNLINDIHATVSSTLGGIYVNMSTASQPTDIRTITGNTISNLSAANSTNSSGASAFGISIATLYGTNTVRGNSINNLSYTSSGTSTLTMYGINNNPQSGSYLARSNIITNITASALNASSTTSGINAGGNSSGTVTIDSNDISFITASAANTNVAVQGIRISNSSLGNVAANEIHDLSSTSTGATTVAGVNASYTSTTNQLTIGENNIWGLNNSNSAGGSIIGMMLAGSGGSSGIGNGTFLVRNNMITLTPVTNTHVFGMYSTSPATIIKAYYNSIYIGGTSTGANYSAAFKRAEYAYTEINLEDNVLVNERSGVGVHNALSNGNVLPTAGWTLSNYNNLYTSNPATLALWTNSNLDFAAYRVASLKDSCSVNQPVSFVNTGSGDLHLQNNSPNFTLAGKAIVGVTTDLDGQARNTFPTMGADELQLPFQGPTITALGSTTICNGDTLILNTSLGSGIQWHKDGVAIAGANSPSLSVSQGAAYSISYSNGCQSGISDTISVTVLPAVTNSYSANICQGQSYSFAGGMLTTAGVYQDTLSTLAGCDSVVSLNLTVFPLPVPSITANGNVLQTSTYPAYQWQLNGVSVPGANSQSYTAQINGNYNVVVMDTNGCSGSSAILTFTGVGITSVAKDKPITVHPNPFDQLITVNGLGLKDRVLLTDITGRVISSWKASKESESFMMNDLAAGHYVLKIMTEAGAVRVNVPMVKK